MSRYGTAGAHPTFPVNAPGGSGIAIARPLCEQHAGATAGGNPTHAGGVWSAHARRAGRSADCRHAGGCRRGSGAATAGGRASDVPIPVLGRLSKEHAQPRCGAARAGRRARTRRPCEQGSAGRSTRPSSAPDIALHRRTAAQRPALYLAAYANDHRKPPDGQRTVRDGHRVVEFRACAPDRADSSYDGRPATFWSGFVLTTVPRCLKLRIWDL